MDGWLEIGKGGREMKVKVEGEMGRDRMNEVEEKEGDGKR